MNYQHIYEFVTVANELHFRRAADRLAMSQSALTSHIQTLEIDLGFQLLDRTRHGVVLTPAGAAFAENARSALQHVDNAGRLVGLSTGVRHQARIGHEGSIALPILERTLVELTARYPDIDIHLVEATTSELIDRLRRSIIDLALLQPFPQDPDLDDEHLIDEHLTVVVWADHPLASRPSLTPEDLAGQPILLPSRTAPTGVYEQLTTQLRRRRLDIGRTPAATSINSVLVLVRAKLGITLLPAQTTTHLHENGTRAIPLDGTNTRLPLHVAWRKTDPNPLLITIRKLLATAAANLDWPQAPLPPPGATHRTA